MPWLVIVIVGVATCLLRATPLLWPADRVRDATSRVVWLNALGPCLLTAMAATVVLPAVHGAAQQGSVVPLGCGLAAVASVMLLRRDPGMATLMGMAIWWMVAEWL